MPIPVYSHYRIQTKPLAWQQVSEHISRHWPQSFAGRATLFGVWRNQIGRERDELNILTHSIEASVGVTDWFKAINDVERVEAWKMVPTLRPKEHVPPQRQGNYAFRHFRTDPGNWDEFLQLCDEAWPGFEASYPDCQIIGLWRYQIETEGLISSVLLTRRPNLSAWERTKIPQGGLEAEVRRKLSRRYDLCASTYVHTTTLLTATDTSDTARWT